MAKKLSQIAATVAFLASFVASPAGASTHWTRLNAGDLIKPPDDGNPATNADTAVYYYGADGLRYVFPNSKTYFTWYSGFNNVKEVDAVQLGSIGLGGNVTYRPGLRMIKIESSPVVYAIDRGGRRRPIDSEAAALALYGNNWNRQIDDVADAFFSNYPEGQPIDDAGDLTPSAATASNPDINTDKDLRAPVEVTMNSDGSLSPASVAVSVGRTVRFRNTTAGTQRIASNPHPAHSGLPGFDSANLAPGLNYVYRFRQAGSFGFHHHENPSHQGSVTVTP